MQWRPWLYTSAQLQEQVAGFVQEYDNIAFLTIKVSWGPTPLAFFRFGGRDRSELFGLGVYRKIYPNLIVS